MSAQSCIPVNRVPDRLRHPGSPYMMEKSLLVMLSLLRYASRLLTFRFLLPLAGRTSRWPPAISQVWDHQHYRAPAGHPGIKAVKARSAPSPPCHVRPVSSPTTVSALPTDRSARNSAVPAITPPPILSLALDPDPDLVQPEKRNPWSRKR